MGEKDVKIDITSKVAETSVDTAKNFLEKLALPSIEEIGLLLKEKVSFWRFRSEVKTLEKASNLCKKHNISPKSISLKLLVPLLENASLEDDEFLDDKWAILLSNLVDSEQNIQNHVFPFLLGQISKSEFLIVENCYVEKKQRLLKIEQELENFRNAKKNERAELVVGSKSWNEKNPPTQNRPDPFNMYEQHLRALMHQENRITAKRYLPDYINEENSKPYEISNLLRLGLIKDIPQLYSYVDDKLVKTIGGIGASIEGFEVEVENDGFKYSITELGEMFIKACKEKNT